MVSYRGKIFASGLFIVALLPALAALVRLAEVAANTADPRFDGIKNWLALHLIGSVGFALAGLYQFVPSGRRNRSHPRMGRLVVAAGLLSAITGLRLSVGHHLPEQDAGALSWVRILVAGSMFVFLLLGLKARWQGAHRQHGAWMIRAYALGLGAGTQILILGPVIALTGEPIPFVRFWGMTLGWAVNAGLAEWIILKLKTRNAQS